MTRRQCTTIQIPLPIEDMTCPIPLSRGLLAMVDAIDGDLIEHKWWAMPKHATLFYACASAPIDTYSKNTRMHRIIMARVLGRPLRSDEYVDHRDCDGLNNHRANLRVANLTQSQGNKRIQTNRTGYKGVIKCGKKWNSRINAKTGVIYLGTFDTPEEAHKAYCDAAAEYFGEFARAA